MKIPDSSGKIREHSQVTCDMCGIPFWKPSRFLKKSPKNYCSHKCGVEARKTDVEIPCDWCGEKFNVKPSRLRNSKHGYHFCSRTCKDTAQRINGIKAIQPPHYHSSHEYRAILRRSGRLTECNRCGYNEHPKILQVHHKDSDRENNSLDNLEVLCPNCHMLEHYGD